ncbi:MULTISPECIES: hypothetical protein [unclassified Streptomyces]|nr:hypothetical protein [Streptomyces sp. TSRI0281]
MRTEVRATVVTAGQEADVLVRCCLGGGENGGAGGGGAGLGTPVEMASSR